MERSLIAVLVAVSISGCTYEVVAPPPVKQTVYSAHDPAAIALWKCDSLVQRGTDAHRLCMMREIDRLKVTPAGFTNLPQAAPIQILPYAYPPLAPRGPTVFLR